jgi:hypothetical protein
MENAVEVEEQDGAPPQGGQREVRNRRGLRIDAVRIVHAFLLLPRLQKLIAGKAHPRHQLPIKLGRRVDENGKQLRRAMETGSLGR